VLFAKVVNMITVPYFCSAETFRHAELLGLHTLQAARNNIYFCLN